MYIYRDVHAYRCAKNPSNGQVARAASGLRPFVILRIVRPKVFESKL